MCREWRESRIIESIEQRVYDQVREIRKNVWLSELELKSIKRQVEGEFQDEVCREQDVTVGAQTIETDAGIVAEGMNDAEDSIGDTEV